MHVESRLDYDPPARRSPRLYGEVGGLACSETSARIARPLSDAKLQRLRHMAIIKACREASPPVPFSTLIGGLGIPETTARRLYKKSRRLHLRRSRV